MIFAYRAYLSSVVIATLLPPYTYYYIAFYTLSLHLSLAVRVRCHLSVNSKYGLLNYHRLI